MHLRRGVCILASEFGVDWVGSGQVVRGAWIPIAFIALYPTQASLQVLLIQSLSFKTLSISPQHRSAPAPPYQLTSPLPRSNPPLSCLSGLTTFPSKMVYLTIPSQSSGLTLASQMACPASRRYTMTLAEYLCPPTWLMK